MTTTVQAIYENGVLKLSRPLELPERSNVLVIIEDLPGDLERALWLRASEASLTKVWDNQNDDVFNDLLKK